MAFKFFVKILLLILVIYAPFSYSQGTPYKIDYDYPRQGDDWYGKTGPITPRTDFYRQTDITTQQGDDFCQGYQSSLVHISQGPEIRRTQISHTAYVFKHIGGTRCFPSVPVPPLPDLIFSNSFE